MAEKEKKNKKDVPKTVTGTINEKGGVLGKMLTPRTSLAKFIAGKGKKKKEAPKPVQGAGNMPLDDKQAAQQIKFLKSKNKEKEVKGMKKMNMGGMTAPSGMDAAAMMAMKKKKRKPMMPAQQAMDGGAAMPMMKKGGKVRGAGMAKKGVRACKMR